PRGTVLFDTAENFKVLVEGNSEGRMTITHYPGTLLGDYSIQQESVAAGTLDMCWTFPVSTLNPAWDLRGIGYITYNERGAEEMFKPGGWAEPLWDQIAEKANWKQLGVLLTAGCHIISNEMYDPLDPGGLKLRVQATKSFIPKYQALGFNPITMPMSEAASALRVGTIDAVAGAGNSEFRIYGDAFEVVTAYHDRFAGAHFIINLDLWKSLSEDDRAILHEAASQTIGHAFSNYKNDVAKDWNDLLEWQKVVTLDGDTWAKCAEKVREAEWNTAEEWIGKDTMDIVRAHADPLPWGKTLDEMEYAYGLINTDWLIARQGEVITGP
ncbi:TRAP transporter substrate-binding protein DctP, partial [Chloroflexota bacterium]